MSDKNKRFRNHCNIDILLDRENNCVHVTVAYKPELLEAPQCWTRCKYDRRDVVGELGRQGIAVGEATSGFHTVLDNTTIAGRHPHVEGTFSFPMTAAANKAEETPNPEPELKKVSKRAPRVKLKPTKDK